MTKSEMLSRICAVLGCSKETSERVLSECERAGMLPPFIGTCSKEFMNTEWQGQGVWVEVPVFKWEQEDADETKK